MREILKSTEPEIKKAAIALKNGFLVAFPTETVYGLGADATDNIATKRIYEVKGRPFSQPLIVHFSNFEKMKNWAREIPDFAFKLANDFWPGPLTLILKRGSLATDLITGSTNNIGVRVPAHPVALNLLKQFEMLGGEGIAAPSANRFGAVSPTSVDDVIDDIGNFLGGDDFVIDGGQCEIGIESTIVDCTSKFPRILRFGVVTETMICNSLNLNRLHNFKLTHFTHPGSSKKHYQPKAKVVLNTKPKTGDGLIAMENINTPDGVTRLLSPSDLHFFARGLYRSFRQADKLGINRIVVIVPEGDDFALAIQERLLKASM